MLLANHIFSLDPTMRNAMAGPGGAAATPQQGISYYSKMNWTPGKVVVWRTIAVVLQAGGGTGLEPGDYVIGALPWRRLVRVPAAQVQKLDAAAAGFSPSVYLGSVGGPGLAAYLPCKHIARPVPGETAFVSGAAGATGSVAAQCLKIMGCTVVGSAGSADKVALLREMGIEAFNYKDEAPLAALQRLAPAGIDIYFDNVGGEILEAAIEVMRDHGRIVACGQISQYDRAPAERYGVKNLFHVVAKRITMRGYITDTESFTPEQFAEARQTLSGWLAGGQLQARETFIEGFERLPEALLGLFTGKNTGKMMVREPLPAAAAAPAAAPAPGAARRRGGDAKL